MTSSVSLFPLTYLGCSLIQRSNDCELETIYELLLEYYLNFLKNVIDQPSSLMPFKNCMSKLCQTVVLAIGNGNLTIRTLDENSDKDLKSKTFVEEKFNAQELLYFNCYYLEVVTPVGRDKETCYAYFRRAVDARRCVPEEALVQLDRKMSNWLLRHRSLVRPPLIYCIVPRSGSIRSLVCFVFLADTIQIGLKIVRCFSELRSSTNTEPSGSQDNYRDRQTKNCVKRASPAVIKRHFDYPLIDQNDNYNVARMYHVDQPRTSYDDNCYNIQTDYTRPCLSARTARSHNDLIMAFDQIDLDDQGHCNASCEFLTNSFNPCPVHTKSSDRHRTRLLQMRLGHEALDFYRHRHRISSADRLLDRNPNRDRSVPDLESREHLVRQYYCPECKANITGPSKTYSPNRIRRRSKSRGRQTQHQQQQQQQQQHQQLQHYHHQYQRDASKSRKSCSPHDRMKPRNNRNHCHCHAHLGGSLELIP